MSLQLQTVHVFGEDYPGDAPWQLLEWCMRQGGTEFTVGGILVEGGSRAVFDAFDRIADSHRLPRSPRYDLCAGRVLVTDLWRLNPDTVSALRVAFPEGYFSYRPADAWHEDLSVYRASGELLFAVVTHESEGVLRITDAEKTSLVSEGFSVHPEGRYVGY
ncbi:MAG: hypothetical protein KF709_12940 [Gemmatimonadaceae bacterium]|nr:hypothetical protein [Gemmatimonadaceae bacterium]